MLFDTRTCHAGLHCLYCGSLQTNCGVDCCCVVVSHICHVVQHGMRAGSWCQPALQSQFKTSVRCQTHMLTSSSLHLSQRMDFAPAGWRFLAFLLWFVVAVIRLGRAREGWCIDARISSPLSVLCARGVACYIVSCVARDALEYQAFWWAWTVAHVPLIKAGHLRSFVSNGPHPGLGVSSLQSAGQ